MIRGTHLLPLLIFGLVGSTSAQLVTDNTAPYNSNAFLVNNVLLDGVTATNVSFQGQARQIGYFTALNTNLGIDSGLVLSTGDIADATGPNSSPSTSVQNNGPATFAPLQSLAGVGINDMALLQFDFQVTGDSIKFNYVFGSEEYPEFVNSINDVFGFFLTGPNPAGGNYVDENIAIIDQSPLPPIPVTINSINCQGNSPYYICNQSPSAQCPPSYNCPSVTTLEMDGFTVKLTAKARVVCGANYTIKLGVADASDQSWDSWVFLEAGSFRQINPIISNFNPFPNSLNDSTVQEGCSYANIKFTSDKPPIDTVKIYYTLGGTATNGVDYLLLPGFVTFDPGMTEKNVTIYPLVDNILEGDETVIISLVDTGCGAASGTSTYIIQDGSQFTVDVSNTRDTSTADSVLIPCDTVVTIRFDALVSGGTPPYRYEWYNQGMLVRTDSFYLADFQRDSSETILLRVYDACYDSDSVDHVIWLIVDSCPEEPIDTVIPPVEPEDVIFPNTFSPDGDGQNDYFFFDHIEQYGSASIRIFNRWGALVYSSDQFELCGDGFCWDGRDQNTARDLPDGVYFYQLIYGEPKTVVNGQVTLVR